MPLPDELRAGLDSKVADIANVTGERAAACSSPGCSCASSSPTGCSGRTSTWPGPAYNDGQAVGLHAKGGTGVPLRTMLASAGGHRRDGLTGSPR